MLLGRIPVALARQGRKRRREGAAGVAGLDHGIEVPAGGGGVGIRKLLPELRYLLGPERVRIGCRRELALVEHVDGPLGAHHSDLRRGPRVVPISAEVLARHDAVGTAVGLARDEGHLRHGRLGEGEQQLRAVADDAAVLLPGTRQEAWHVLEGEQRNIERVAEPHEPRRLDRRVDVERPGQMLRLIGHHADAAAGQPQEADDDVPGKLPVHLQKPPVVCHRLHEIEHVVRLGQ